MTTKIDSKIITFQHAELILKWIDRLEATDEIKNMYEFKLILRGSRDGFTPETFHEICDNQSHTVTIIKEKNSNEILGGYNPIAWKSVGGYTATNDSFIFSFSNDNIESHTLSRVIDKEHAIYNISDYGPSFGTRDLDLYGNEENKLYDWEISYEKQITAKPISWPSVEEYEVFQIIK